MSRAWLLILLALGLTACAYHAQAPAENRRAPTLGLGGHLPSHGVQRPHTSSRGLLASLVDPTIPAVGETVTTSNGTWSNSPTSYAYVWKRCNSVPVCFTIAGATSTSYVITAADVGYKIKSIVTASNVYGASSQTSTPTGYVIPNYGTALPAPLASPAPLQTFTASPTTGDTTSLFTSLAPGDSLCLNNGSYGASSTASATISVSGTAANPITIKSCSGVAVIHQLWIISGNYIRLTGLSIQGNLYPTDARSPSCAGGGPAGNVGIWFKGSHDTLESSGVTGATMSGIFSSSTAANDQILNDVIHANGSSSDDHGIYWAGPNVLIANNQIYDNYAFGVQLAYGNMTGGIVANNTLVNNGIGSSCLGSGAVTFSGTHGNVFVNNIAWNNRDVGYKTYDTGANTLSHDLAYANPNGSTFGSWLGSTPDTRNPLLVSSSDFHLQSSSPAINIGDPVYTPAYDYYGTRRRGADLGAIAAP